MEASSAEVSLPDQLVALEAKLAKATRKGRADKVAKLEGKIAQVRASMAKSTVSKKRVASDKSEDEPKSKKAKKEKVGSGDQSLPSP